jgi:hypothetical protein
MAHYYYLVYFDEETKEWIHDVDSEEIRLEGKTIWNTETEEWESGYLGDGIWNDKQDKTDEIMNDGLQYLNRISAVWHLKKEKNGN